MGPLIPLFWTSGDVFYGFYAKLGWIPHLHASSPVHNRFLTFTSGVTPADLLEASMAADRMPHMYVAEVGCRDSIERPHYETKL